MSTANRIGLGVLGVACAGISITVGSKLPDWPGAVTWLVISFFGALAIGSATILIRDMTRRRTRPEPVPEDRPPITLIAPITPVPPLLVTPSSPLPQPTAPALDLSDTTDAVVEDSLFEGFDQPIAAPRAENPQLRRNQMYRDARPRDK
jgi:hypothetical protein